MKTPTKPRAPKKVAAKKGHNSELSKEEKNNLTVQCVADMMELWEEKKKISQSEKAVKAKVKAAKATTITTLLKLVALEKLDPETRAIRIEDEFNGYIQMGYQTSFNFKQTKAKKAQTKVGATTSAPAKDPAAVASANALH